MVGRFAGGLPYSYRQISYQITAARKVSMDKVTQNKRRFIGLCMNIKRDGMYEFLEWLKGSDFFSAPASTRYHGNYYGGLLEHSLNVYDALKGLLKVHPEVEVPEESVILVSLFHDICKANFYVKSFRNVKRNNEWVKEEYYTIDDKFPVGHGEKSLIILLRYLNLTDDEIYAIRYHMGGYDSSVKGGDYSESQAFEKSKLAVLTHLADMTATYLMNERKGDVNV